MNEEIHIGEIIRKQLKEDGRSMVWLAEKLNYERANIYRLLNRPHIDTYLLLRIARILRHDFFAYYSDLLLFKKETHISDHFSSDIIKNITFAKKHYEA